MIEVKNICKSFQLFNNKHFALKNVSFQLDTNSCTLICGENGSGKSLLMSIIAGLEKADSGSILFSDNINKKVGLVFQEAETQILGETPREDISFGPKNLGWSKDKIQIAVDNALKNTGLINKADFPARFLSGGEKRRLAVACMIAMNLDTIIFDEPYANLDFTGVHQVNELIKNLKSQGKTIIILTHEIEKCLGLTNKFIVLFRGEKVFDGTPKDGLLQNLETWNIKNPRTSYDKLKDFIW